MMQTPKGIFKGELLTKDLDDGINFELLEPLTYIATDGKMITVPKGFVTDFASVPRFLPIAYALFKNTANRAATIHDWLYRMTDTPRSYCDWIFKDAMEATDKGFLHRWTMYLGVRIGGWWAREKVDGIVDGRPAYKKENYNG